MSDHDESDNENMDEDDEDQLLQIEQGDSNNDDEDEDEFDLNNEDSTLELEDNFDGGLPSRHSYLGDDLEEVRGRTILDDDAFLNLPVLYLPDVVLIPGQKLPLLIYQPMTVAMIKNVLQGDKTFGLLTLRRSTVDQTSLSSSIGTTAEISSVKEVADEASGVTSIKIITTGRQRFEVIETNRRVDGTSYAKVRILRERLLTNPLEGAIPFSLLKHFSYNERESSPTSEYSKPKKKKIDRFYCANITAWSSWVYKQYDLESLMSAVRDEIVSWTETLNISIIPTDAVSFSYWIASNLPLDDGMKLYLLSLNNAVQRLRCELSIMQRCTVLACCDCYSLIAVKRDIFTLSREGPLAAYVNPHGAVHETLTLHRAQGLKLIGRATAEYSWFPGYAWTICQCRTCSRHMGWKFTAQDSNLKPSKFWGLCRSALLCALKKDPEVESNTSWLPLM